MRPRRSLTTPWLNLTFVLREMETTNNSLEGGPYLSDGGMLSRHPSWVLVILTREETRTREEVDLHPGEMEQGGAKAFHDWLPKVFPRWVKEEIGFTDGLDGDMRMGRSQ